LLTAPLSPYYGGNQIITADSLNPSVPYLLTGGGGLFGGDPFAPLQVDQQSADDGVLDPSQAWCTASVAYPYNSPPFESPSPGTTIGPPSVGPPTYTANNPCFPHIEILIDAHVKG
jgi:hypothetical protein